MTTKTPIIEIFYYRDPEDGIWMAECDRLGITAENEDLPALKKEMWNLVPIMAGEYGFQDPYDVKVEFKPKEIMLEPA